jgi:hypothetical protein
MSKLTIKDCQNTISELRAENLALRTQIKSLVIIQSTHQQRVAAVKALVAEHPGRRSFSAAEVNLQLQLALH